MRSEDMMFMMYMMCDTRVDGRLRESDSKTGLARKAFCMSLTKVGIESNRIDQVSQLHTFNERVTRTGVQHQKNAAFGSRGISLLERS